MANTPIRLIVGLGNPGPEYERTRHNAGFRFLDALADKNGGTFRNEPKFKGEIARARIAGEEVWLLKPLTFMNSSGESVSAVANYYKIKPEEILVVHDELDLPPGCMKIKQGGGNAGHNGLKDISAKLSTPNFWRLRLGTGHPRTLGMAQQVADFVLSAPSSEHEAAIEDCIGIALKEAGPLAEGDFTGVSRRLAKYGNPPQPPKKAAE